MAALEAGWFCGEVGTVFISRYAMNENGTVDHERQRSTES